MLVPGRRDARAQETRVLVDAFKHRGEKGEEPDVLVRGFARLEQVRSVQRLGARVYRHRPIAMLARAVDAGKGLFVQERLQVMAQCNAAQRRHHQLVVIDGDVGLLVARRHLELARRHFVVSRDDRHAELVELVLDFGDARLDALGYTAEVVILELLSARRRRAEKGAPSHHEVGAHCEVRAIDEEVLLFRTERRRYAGDALVAEERQKLDCLRRERIGGTKQRRHFIECFAIVADEHGWDAQRAHTSPFGDEHRAGGIPGRIAASLPGRAKAARGKARGIGL